jgi:protein-S-isoprenylcysteine O-methyltransferase Ste14
VPTSQLVLLLAPPVIAAGLWRYRADFRRHGRTTPLGVTLLLAAWLMPHLVLGYAIPLFQTPTTPRQWTGYVLMAIGLVGCALALRRRFSTAMVVGRDATSLVTDGPYRWSRNPQYVAYTPFPIGYALTGVAPMAWAGVALYLVLVHLTVRVEEEHLARQFGDRYRDYRAATPRYLPRRFGGAPS